MNILMTEGYDMYNGTGTNTGVQTLWSFASSTGGGGASVSMQTGRFSGQCMRLVGGSGFNAGDYTAWRLFNPSGNSTTVCWGFAFKNTTTSNQGGRLSEMRTLAGSSQFGIGYTSAGAFYVYTGAGGTQQGSSSAAGLMPSSTWVYIEVEATLSATVGTVNIYLNGASILSITGANTLNAGGSGAGMLQFYTSITSDSTSLFTNFDDIYVTDTATRLGECKIETLRPSGDSTAVWTPNSGSNNYSRVNETLVDGDTSYVSTASTGVRDLYTIGSLSSTPASIYAVNVVSFAEKTDATTRQLYNSVRSASTDSDGAAANLAAAYNRQDRIVQLDPATSAAWTASGVNNLLIGPKAA